MQLLSYIDTYLTAYLSLECALNLCLTVIVCPMQYVALDRYNITWMYVCMCVCPKYLSFTMATEHFACEATFKDLLLKIP